MNLECNLVRSTEIYGQVFPLIARKRVDLNGASEINILDAIKSFIQDNVDTFDAALYDKLLVTELNSIELTTVNQLQGLKFLLANHGVDLLIYEVSEVEINSTGVDPETIEYNIIDTKDVSEYFVPFTSKLVMGTQDVRISELYETILSRHEYFKGEVFSGFNNPIMNMLDVIKSTEDAIGSAPVSLTSSLLSALEYLGIKVELITP